MRHALRFLLAVSTLAALASAQCNPASRAFYGRPCSPGPGLQIGNSHILPKLGAQGNLLMRFGPSNGAGAFLIGTGRDSLDLTPFGAPRCTKLVQVVLVVVPTTFDATGFAAPRAVPIPNDPSLCGAGVTVQGLARWAIANPLGIAVTRGIELRVGT